MKKQRKKQVKKGVSPLIATVLLTGFTVAIVSLVVVWGRGFTEERAEKEEALAHAKLSCENLDFTVTSASFDSGGPRLALGIKNKGATSMDSFVFRINEGDGVVEWGEQVEGLGSRQLVVEDPTLEDFEISGVNDVEIIPKIMVARGVYIPCSSKAKTVNKITAV